MVSGDFGNLGLGGLRYRLPLFTYIGTARSQTGDAAVCWTFRRVIPAAFSRWHFSDARPARRGSRLREGNRRSSSKAGAQVVIAAPATELRNFRCARTARASARAPLPFGYGEESGRGIQPLATFVTTVYQ